MNLKKFALTLAALALLLTGCSAAEKPRVQIKPTYSNLTEESVRLDLDSLMNSAGIPGYSRRVFFDHVDQINAVAGPERLTNGFTPVGEVLYDPYELQTDWETAYPDFMGYNCRITAFSLYGSFLGFPQEPMILGEEMTMFDQLALESDPSAGIALEGFRAFYATVPTELKQDRDFQAGVWLDSWQDRGIAFPENDKVSLISVVFHSDLDDPSTLFIGHTGLLFPTPDGELWFLEKLSFQEPYQLVVFGNRQQLSSYLMEKYDVDENQPVARPFILENDSLLQTAP